MPKRTYYIHAEQGTGINGRSFTCTFAATSRWKWLARFLAYRRYNAYRNQRNLTKQFLRITRESWK